MTPTAHFPGKRDACPSPGESISQMGFGEPMVRSGDLE